MNQYLPDWQPSSHASSGYVSLQNVVILEVNAISYGGLIGDALNELEELS